MSPNALLSYEQFNVEGKKKENKSLFSFTFYDLYLHGKPLEHLLLGNQTMNTTIL